jgi:hypothetical protein
VIISNSGEALDASFSVEHSSDDHAVIVFESRGPGRNPDYVAGLEALLDRLGNLDAILVDALVDTQETRRNGLSESDRRLIPTRELPQSIALGAVDTRTLAGSLRRAQRTIGQGPGATGGNETRRMVMTVRAGKRPFPSLLESVLAGSVHLGVVYVPARRTSAENLKIGLEWGVWGFNADAMLRSNYLREFQSLREGDLVLLGHRGPSPRVGVGSWTDARVAAGHLGVITSVDVDAREKVWPDDLYPYRFQLTFVSRYQDFGADEVGADVMEALRLSANQQGRVVVLPRGDSLLAHETRSASPLAIDGPLDNLIQSTHRREQRSLRKARLGSVASAPCDLCGKVLPVRYLRMAHIKPRAVCSDSEKLDPNVVMSACIECDALFETGELVVDETGTIHGLPRADATPELKELLVARHGLKCGAFSDGTSGYFAFHRS